MPQWVKWKDQKHEDLDMITRTHRVNLQGSVCNPHTMGKGLLEAH